MTNRKVAVITGASAGIGKETALAFARAGYAVVLAARRKDTLENIARQCRELGGEALVAPTDVAERAQVEALIQTVMRQFGRLDVLVNNAGYGLFARAHETTVDQMRRIFDVNFYGVFYACQLAAPLMIQQGGGHIFNVSSVIGKRGTPFHGAYCATKFALVGFDDSMRVELKPHNVMVTTVCPALTETEFFDHVEGDQDSERSGYIRLRKKQHPAVIGRKIVTTVGKYRPELVFTLGGKFLAYVSAWFPKAGDFIMGVYLKELLKETKK